MAKIVQILDDGAPLKFVKDVGTPEFYSKEGARVRSEGTAVIFYDEIGKTVIIEHADITNPIVADAEALANTIQGMLDTVPIGGGATEATLLQIRDQGRDETHRKGTDATYDYLGFAVPGTATAAASWQAMRINRATSELMYADGNSNYDNIWDNHLILAYS